MFPSSSSKIKFLKPGDIDKTFQEDISDVDPASSTTFVYNPHFALPFEQQRQRLPIFNYRNHILYLLEKYQTLVLVGETGCGKSTQIPQYLVEAGWAKSGKIVGITEPRRVAATTLAARVAEEKGSLLGGLVGYSIRFDDCIDANMTKIKFMTEGILLREMMADPLLRQYCVIILDEVHERTLYTDVIMGLLKKIIRKNTSLKLIVSSATVDAEEMHDFFNFNKTTDKAKDTSVIMTVLGRTYSVEIFYLEDPTPNYVQEVADTVLKIHKSEIHGDILAFLTGQEEVERAVAILKEQEHAKGKDGLKLVSLAMHGSLPYADQLKVFQRADQGFRKAIIATNIAETSITVRGVVYVVDCGFVKIRRFDPDTCMDSLIVIPVSKSSAEQRAGRAGRERTGKIYRLYRESDFEKLPEASPREMQRSELSTPILQLKALGIHNVLRFDFPSPPPAQNLLLALELLYALEAIDNQGQLTTPLGANMAELPMHPVYAKTLLVSGDMGCSEEIITILSCLQVQTIFTKPFSGQASIKARVQQRKFEVAEGDLLTLLNAYNAFEQSGRNKDWCYSHFLNYKGLKRAREIRGQMKKMLEKFKIPIVSAAGNNEIVLKAITSGMFPNAAYLHHSGVHQSVRGGKDLYIHPSSVLYTQVQPQWVLFCDLIHTNKPYMKNVTIVFPEWLEELAPHFYHKTVVPNF